MTLVQHFDRAVFTRMFAAGGAWGLAVAAGFLALNATQCGMPCPDDIAVMSGVCVATGIITIGPLAAFGARR